MKFKPSDICCTLVYIATEWLHLAPGGALSQNLLEFLGYASDFCSTSPIIIVVNIKFYKQQKNLNCVLTKLVPAEDSNLN